MDKVARWCNPFLISDFGILVIDGWRLESRTFWRETRRLWVDDLCHLTQIREVQGRVVCFIPHDLFQEDHWRDVGERVWHRFSGLDVLLWVKQVSASARLVLTQAGEGSSVARVLYCCKAASIWGYYHRWRKQYVQVNVLNLVWINSSMGFRHRIFVSNLESWLMGLLPRQGKPWAMANQPDLRILPVW